MKNSGQIEAVINVHTTNQELWGRRPWSNGVNVRASSWQLSLPDARAGYSETVRQAATPWLDLTAVPLEKKRISAKGASIGLTPFRQELRSKFGLVYKLDRVTKVISAMPRRVA
jgi:hypothetical protein